MNLKIGISYKINLRIDNVNLTYNCKIIEQDDDSITFIDKFGSTFSYAKKYVVYAEEVKNGY